MSAEELPEKLFQLAQNINKQHNPQSAPIKTFNRYQIQRELGRGGMGVVYGAYDTKWKTTVALKIITSEEKEYIDRFFLETSAIAKLNHPNIVRFYEYGETPKPHFTMEYIDGNTLSDLIKDRNVDPLYLVDIMIPLCEALHFAHKNKIMHRDIKPSNIMITRDGTPKIMDFGLAKVTDATKQLSKSGQMMGTLFYMPPEQVKGKACYKSDIYSLGASIYEALTYRTVFQGQLEVNIILQIMNEAPIPLRHLNPDISPYLEAICLKCLSKNPKKRYSGFKQLSRELKNFKNHRPILAKKYNSWDVLQNFIYKHKVICISIFLIFIILSVSLGITTNALNYATKQKDIAGEALKQTKEINEVLEKEKKQSNKLAKTVTKALKYAISKDTNLYKDQKYLTFFKDILKQTENSKSKNEFEWLRGLVLGLMGNKGDQQKGIEYFNKIILNNPKNFNAYYNRGNLYHNWEKYREAESDYNKAIALNPNFAHIYANRGLLYRKQKRYKEAENDYNKAIALDANLLEAYLNRGLIYRIQKRYKEAENDYNKIISLNPNLTNAYINRGKVYYNQKKYTKAIQDWKKAISLGGPKLEIQSWINKARMMIDKSK